MAFPLTLPSTNPPSTNWGGTVNANWTTLNNAFQTQALFTGTTSATSPITGSVIIGNGTAATSIGMGAGNIYAGNSINAAYVFTSNTDTTTTSGVSALRNNLTLYASPASASTAAYVAMFVQSYGLNANLTSAGTQGINITSGISIAGSGSSSLGGTYGLISTITVQNSGIFRLIRHADVSHRHPGGRRSVGSGIRVFGHHEHLYRHPPRFSDLSGKRNQEHREQLRRLSAGFGSIQFLRRPDPFRYRPGGSDPVRIGGALTISDTKMMTTKTAFTNGAGSGTGSLTNAPFTGTPSKWIPINDNGTTRYIPAR